MSHCTTNLITLHICHCCIVYKCCRALPEEELISRISEALVAAGILTSASSAFAAAVSSLVKGSVDMLGDAAGQVPQLLSYPLSETVQSEDFKPVRGGAGCEM
jgi:hypothetical protein